LLTKGKQLSELCIQLGTNLWIIQFSMQIHTPYKATSCVDWPKLGWCKFLSYSRQKFHIITGPKNVNCHCSYYGVKPSRN